MSDEKNIPEKSASPHHHNDELAEIKQIIGEYGKPALTVLLVVMIAFSAFQFYNMRKISKIEEASTKLNAARSIPDLEAIVANYSNTQAAEMALIALAKQNFDNANYEVAFTKYEDFIRDYPENNLIDTAKLGRIFCIEARNNDAALQEAATAYAAFTQAHSNSFLAPQAIFGQARCLEQLNQLDQARIIYEDFIANTPDSPWIMMAEDQLEQLSRKISNDSTNGDITATTAPVTETKELPENTTGTVLDPESDGDDDA